MARSLMTRLSRIDQTVRLAVAYADATGDDASFVIPEDLATLSDEALTQLHDEAVVHFDELYSDGTALSDEVLSALAGLTEGIESLAAESGQREAQALERATTAADLAARVRPNAPDASAEDPAQGPASPPVIDQSAAPVAPAPNVVPSPNGAPVASVTEPVLVTASSAPRGPIRVNMPGLRSRTAPHTPQVAPRTLRDVLVAGSDASGFSSGQGMSWDDVGVAVDRRLMTFNSSQYAAAASHGTHLREQHSIAIIRNPIPDNLVVHTNDWAHVEEILNRATDESLLPGGSLVASGGWCAPSEIRYELVELESRDGLFSVPEIGVSRGGIQFTPGPNFSDFYAQGFAYTEAQDIAGDYNGAGGGAKPCYQVTCPPFQEKRLGPIGLCIKAGLLQQRGYPEVVARTVRGSLIAHDHRYSAASITAVIAGSTTVTMTPAQIGAVAPMLDSIEKQVEHYRYTFRMKRDTTLEAVFPYWIHGVIRSDLARRQGMDVDALAVTDAQINDWFTLRGIAAQFVYDWPPLTGTAAAFLTWPATLSFLLYAAGTWVRGISDIITLDTIYDSLTLGTNEYTALFTEEGYFMAKRGHDSRVITVALMPNGGTGAPQILTAGGTL